MRDLIQSLLETEAQAKRSVQEARAEAERLVNAARKQANQVAAGRRLETRAEAEKLLQTALEQAGQQKRERLREAEVEIAKRVQLDPATTEQIVQAVVRCICGASVPSARADQHQAAGPNATGENQG